MLLVSGGGPLVGVAVAILFMLAFFAVLWLRARHQRRMRKGLTMHILITGAAGMIGRKVTERLLADGRIGKREITKLTLHDVVAPDAQPTAQTSILPIVGDISDRSLVDRLVSEKPDIVMHLAAIVSGEAEADFDKGYAVNFDGTRLLFDAVRVQNYGRA